MNFFPVYCFYRKPTDNLLTCRPRVSLSTWKPDIPFQSSYFLLHFAKLNLNGCGWNYICNLSLTPHNTTLSSIQLHKYTHFPVFVELYYSPSQVCSSQPHDASSVLLFSSVTDLLSHMTIPSYPILGPSLSLGPCLAIPSCLIVFPCLFLVHSTWCTLLPLKKTDIRIDPCLCSHNLTLFNTFSQCMPF